MALISIFDRLPLPNLIFVTFSICGSIFIHLWYLRQISGIRYSPWYKICPHTYSVGENLVADCVDKHTYLLVRAWAEFCTHMLFALTLTLTLPLTHFSRNIFVKGKLAPDSHCFLGHLLLKFGWNSEFQNSSLAFGKFKTHYYRNACRPNEN